MLRLCSMIGENTILLDEFIQHYKQLGVEQFHFIIHDESNNRCFSQNVLSILNKYNIKAEQIYTGHWNGAICTQLLNSILHKYQNDWFVVADQDEFQIYPNDTLNDMIHKAENKKLDYITGALIDRVSQDGCLENFDSKRSIWEQFPLCGFFSFPITRANPYKIALCKGNVILSEGQHGIILPGQQYPQTNDVLVEVHHFKWNSSQLEKIRKRLDCEQQGWWINSYDGYKTELECCLNYFQKNCNIDVKNPLFCFAFEKQGHSYCRFQDIQLLMSDWDILHAYPSALISNQESFDAAVIISSFNQGKIIKKSVEELIGQATKSDRKIQIIIADDGSKLDEKITCLSLTKYNTEKIKVQFITQEDKGFRLAASRNNGIKIAQSNLLIFIDGDCLPLNGFLDAHIKFHQQSPQTFCVGSRGYAPLSALASHNSAISANTLQEDMENYTIEQKAGSKTPWRAVLGRNFSIKHPYPLPLFDEKIEGWGFEDTSFAIDLFFKDYTKVIFCKDAKVVQYDDFSETNDPFISQKADKIVATQRNAIYLMKKYQKYDDIFITIGMYLSFFAEPFDYVNGVFILNEKKRKKVHQDFAEGRVKSKAEYIQLINTCMENIKNYYKHPQIQVIHAICKQDVIKKLPAKENTRQ